MADSAGDPQDPFRTDGSPPPAKRPEDRPPAPRSQPPSQQPGQQPGRPTERPPASPESRRLALRLGVVTVAAVAAAFVAPPVGAVLGALAIAQAVRSRDLVASRPRLLAVIGGVLALTVGLAITGLALLLREEIAEYSSCMRAANTVQAQQNCQDALNDSLSSRLGL